MLCSFVFNLFFAQILRLLYVLENRKRDRALAGKSDEELKRMSEESNLMGFENVTDGNNVSRSPYSYKFDELFTVYSADNCLQAMFRYTL
jgi:hypothetical protein